MERSDYVAALDLGTSKMIAMAARRGKDEKQLLTILEAKRVESKDCIRRGCVYNIDATGYKVASLVAELSKKLENPIEKTYVGIGGQSLRTQTYSAVRNVLGVVDQNVIDSLDKECSSYQPADAEVLDIVSREYFTDGISQNYPKGTVCKKIEERVVLVLGNPSLKTYLKKSVEEKGRTKIAGFFVSPIATAAAVLCDAEKEKGCALVEFGAGITYVSVYKEKLLRYMVAIPLGSHIITKDICDLEVSEKEAEEMKVNFEGDLLESDDWGQAETDINNEILKTIIQARMNEILANVIEQIKLSGYASCLGAGIVITGGGAYLKNLRAVLQKQTVIDVRILGAKKILFDQANDIINQPENSTVIGLLSLGKENCAREKLAQPAEPVNTRTDLFGNPLPLSAAAATRYVANNAKKINNNGGLFGKMKNKIAGMSDSLFGEEEETEVYQEKTNSHG